MMDEHSIQLSLNSKFRDRQNAGFSTDENISRSQFTYRFAKKPNTGNVLNLNSGAIGIDPVIVKSLRFLPITFPNPLKRLNPSSKEYELLLKKKSVYLKIVGGFEQLGMHSTSLDKYEATHALFDMIRLDDTVYNDIRYDDYVRLCPNNGYIEVPTKTIDYLSMYFTIDDHTLIKFDKDLNLGNLLYGSFCPKQILLNETPPYNYTPADRIPHGIYAGNSLNVQISNGSNLNNLISFIKSNTDAVNNVVSNSISKIFNTIDTPFAERFQNRYIIPSRVPNLNGDMISYFNKSYNSSKFANAYPTFESWEPTAVFYKIDPVFRSVLYDQVYVPAFPSIDQSNQWPSRFDDFDIYVDVNHAIYTGWNQFDKIFGVDNNGSINVTHTSISSDAYDIQFSTSEERTYTDEYVTSSMERISGIDKSIIANIDSTETSANMIVTLNSEAAGISNRFVSIANNYISINDELNNAQTNRSNTYVIQSSLSGNNYILSPSPPYELNASVPAGGRLFNLWVSVDETKTLNLTSIQAFIGNSYAFDLSDTKNLHWAGTNTVAPVVIVRDAGTNAFIRTTNYMSAPTVTVGTINSSCHLQNMEDALATLMPGEKYVITHNLAVNAVPGGKLASYSEIDLSIIESDYYRIHSQLMVSSLTNSAGKSYSDLYEIVNEGQQEIDLMRKQAAQLAAEIDQLTKLTGGSNSGSRVDVLTTHLNMATGNLDQIEDMKIRYACQLAEIDSKIKTNKWRISNGINSIAQRGITSADHRMSGFKTAVTYVNSSSPMTINGEVRPLLTLYPGYIWTFSEPSCKIYDTAGTLVVDPFDLSTYPLYTDFIALHGSDFVMSFGAASAFEVTIKLTLAAEALGGSGSGGSSSPTTIDIPAELSIIDTHIARRETIARTSLNCSKAFYRDTYVIDDMRGSTLLCRSDSDITYVVSSLPVGHKIIGSSLANFTSLSDNVFSISAYASAPAGDDQSLTVQRPNSTTYQVIFYVLYLNTALTQQQLFRNVVDSSLGFVLGFFRSVSCTADNRAIRELAISEYQTTYGVTLTDPQVEIAQVRDAIDLIDATVAGIDLSELSSNVARATSSLAEYRKYLSGREFSINPKANRIVWEETSLTGVPHILTDVLPIGTYDMSQLTEALEVMFNTNTQVGCKYEVRWIPTDLGSVTIKVTNLTSVKFGINTDILQQFIERDNTFWLTPTSWSSQVRVTQPVENQDIPVAIIPTSFSVVNVCAAIWEPLSLMMTASSEGQTLYCTMLKKNNHSAGFNTLMTIDVAALSAKNWVVETIPITAIKEWQPRCLVLCQTVEATPETKWYLVEYDINLKKSTTVLIAGSIVLPTIGTTKNYSSCVVNKTNTKLVVFKACPGNVGYDTEDAGNPDPSYPWRNVAYDNADFEGTMFDSTSAQVYSGSNIPSLIHVVAANIDLEAFVATAAESPRRPEAALLLGGPEDTYLNIVCSDEIPDAAALTDPIYRSTHSFTYSVDSIDRMKFSDDAHFITYNCRAWYKVGTQVHNIPLSIWTTIGVSDEVRIRSTYATFGQTLGSCGYHQSSSSLTYPLGPLGGQSPQSLALVIKGPTSIGTPAMVFEADDMISSDELISSAVSQFDPTQELFSGTAKTVHRLGTETYYADILLISYDSGSGMITSEQMVPLKIEEVDDFSSVSIRSMNGKVGFYMVGLIGINMFRCVLQFIDSEWVITAYTQVVDPILVSRMLPYVRHELTLWGNTNSSACTFRFEMISPGLTVTTAYKTRQCLDFTCYQNTVFPDNKIITNIPTDTLTFNPSAVVTPASPLVISDIYATQAVSGSITSLIEAVGAAENEKARGEQMLSSYSYDITQQRKKLAILSKIIVDINNSNLGGLADELIKCVDATARYLQDKRQLQLTSGGSSGSVTISMEPTGVIRLKEQISGWLYDNQVLSDCRIETLDALTRAEEKYDSYSMEVEGYKAELIDYTSNSADNSIITSKTIRLSALNDRIALKQTELNTNYSMMKGIISEIDYSPIDTVRFNELLSLVQILLSKMQVILSDLARVSFDFVRNKMAIDQQQAINQSSIESNIANMTERLRTQIIVFIYMLVNRLNNVNSTTALYVNTDKKFVVINESKTTTTSFNSINMLDLVIGGIDIYNEKDRFEIPLEVNYMQPYRAMK